MKKRFVALMSTVCLMLCLVSPAAAAAQTVEVAPTSWKDTAFDMFETLGFCAASAGEYYYAATTAPDSLVYYYLTFSGAFEEYYDENTEIYSVPYAEYIAAADIAFANHSDMIDYLAERYDPETSLVTWCDGGWGDAVSWEPLSYYEDGDYLYVTGAEVWYDYGPESFNDDEYGEKWVYVHMGEESFKAMITKPLLMRAKKREAGLRLFEFHEIDYHVVDNTIYDDVGNEAYYPLTVSRDNTYFYNTVDTQAQPMSYYGVEGEWINADKTLQFCAKPYLGYRIDSVVVNGDEIVPNDAGVYEYGVTGATDIVINAVATGENVATQADAYTIFKDLGFSTWGSGYFSDTETAPSSVVFSYLNNSGLVSSYYDSSSWMYHVPYDEYMAIVDKAFKNHTDMKSYLGSDYDPETGMVSWYSGGYGGPVAWVPLSYCEEGNLVYVTGVMADYGQDPETFSTDTYGTEWLYASTYSYTYPAKIDDSIVLLAEKTENGLQILAYLEWFYHIVDGILYDHSDDNLQYCMVDLEAENVYFRKSESSPTDIHYFVASDKKWVQKDCPFIFSIEPHYGYEVVEVLFNGELIAPDENGLYEVTFTKASSLEVNTVATCEFIDSVDLIVSSDPTVGDVVSLDGLSVPDGVHYYIGQNSGFTWLVSDTPDGCFVPVSEDAVFESGKYYAVSGALMSEEGYAFSQNATASVNGVQADSFAVFGDHIGLQSVIGVHEHTLTFFEELPASYTRNGLSAHYECECGRWFEDKNAQIEIEDHSSVVLEKLIPEVTEGKAQVNEQAIEDAMARDEEKDTVSIPLEEVSESITAVELPVAALQNVVDAEKSLAIQTADVSVVLNAAALQMVAEQSSEQDSVTLTVEKIHEEELNDDQKTALQKENVRAVISAEILCGDTVIHDFAGGEVTVSIPLEEEENDDTVYVVWYIADDGSVEEYDAVYENGLLTVTLSHFSEYAVVKYMQGDANGDNIIDTSDAREMLRYFVGLITEEEIQIRVIDLNGDAEYDTCDVRMLLKQIIAL